MEQKTNTEKNKMLKEPCVMFFLGMCFGLMVTGTIVGDKMIPKAILNMKKIYIDGTTYEIRRTDETGSRN